MTDRKKLLDGARFWTDMDLPEHYQADPKTGLRPGQKDKPSGTVLVRLQSYNHATSSTILPTRKMWRKGKWLSSKPDMAGSDEYCTWIVDADGTPGNYRERHYVLPTDIATEAEIPKHPADWPKPSGESSWWKGTGGSKSVGTKPKSSGLPFGIRFRCPGCGHWYKESDLQGHASCCPKSEGGEAQWAIACECCESLDDTAKCKPGYPLPSPTAEAKKKDDDKADEKKGDDADGGGTPAT